MPRSTRRSDPGGPIIYVQDTGHLSPRASVLPGSAKDQERWKQGKKNDLIELVESELRQLLKEYPLTLEEVQTVGFAIKKQEQKLISNGDGGVSSRYSSQDLDNPRTQLALRLNSVNKDLAKIRFSLVPSRLKEPVFWEATIHLVKERLMEYNDRCQQQNGGGTTENNGSSVAPPTKGGAVPPNGNSSKSTYHKSLEEQLAKKDAEIAQLKKQLEDVQETLLDVAKLPSSQPTSAPSTTTTTTTTTTKKSSKQAHKGQWKMSKDSEEFLTYPEQVKGAMRAEKQKRLNQVNEELKFILDSDDVADSHGQWGCCGNTDYDADCSTRAEI